MPLAFGNTFETILVKACNPYDIKYIIHYALQQLTARTRIANEHYKVCAVNLKSYINFALCLVFVLGSFSIPAHARVEFEDTIADFEDTVIEDRAVNEEVHIQPRQQSDSQFDLRFITRKGIVYELKGAPYTAEAQNEFFNVLTEDERAAFLKVRAKKLQRLLFILHYSKLVFGGASITGNKIKQTYQFSKDKISAIKKSITDRFRNKKEIQEAIDQMEQPVQLIAADIESQSDQLPADKKTFFEKLKIRSHEVVQSILESKDRSMWRSPQFTMNKNEHMLLLGIMWVKIYGVHNKVSGSGRGYAISFGYNKTSKALVFQTHVFDEKIIQALPFATVVGLTLKVGAYSSVQKPGQEQREFKGKSFYPVGIPAYVDTYENMYGIGTNYSSFPFVHPFGIADMSSYINDNALRTPHRAAISGVNIARKILMPYRWAVDLGNGFKATELEPINPTDLCVQTMLRSRQ